MQKIALLAALGLLFSCTEKPEDTQEKPTPNRTGITQWEVQTVAIKAGSFAREIICTGTLEAKQKAPLYFKTNETLLQSYAQNGDFVQNGSLLATSSNERANAQLATAQAALANARHRRMEKLIEFGYADSATVPEQIQKTINVQSGYLTAQAQLNQALLSIKQTKLTAPFAGTVANITAKPGEVVGMNRPYCFLLNTAVFELLAPIPENYAVRLKLGLPVTLQPYALHQSYPAIISEINPVVNKNGLVQIKIAVNNTNNILMEGMNCKATIKSPMPQLLAIPKTAVVIRSGREVAFTYQNGLAKWKYITIAYENSQYYGISEGLAPGDTLIISNNLNLAHDSKVIYNL